MCNIFHINAVAPRQQCSRINSISLPLITTVTIDRPRRQCSRSSICQSSLSVLLSVWQEDLSTSHWRLTLTLIVIMTIDRPRTQCSRSSIRQSPRSTGTTFSVVRRSTGAVALTPTLILTIDWPRRQCSRSPMSAVTISQYEFGE